MNDLGSNSRQAAEYLDWFRSIWPLALLASVLAFLVGTRQLKRSYLQRNWFQLLGNMLWSTLVTGALALGSVALLPLVVQEPTRGMEIGVVIFVCVFGIKLVDAVLHKAFGLSVVDLMDAEDINEIRLSMTPEQQEKHARNCPFHCKGCRRQ